MFSKLNETKTKTSALLLCWRCVY